MKYMKPKFLAIVILFLLSVEAIPRYIHDEVVDSMISHIQVSYGKKMLPPELDSMINKYKNDSNGTYRNYNFWEGMYKIIINDAKKKHPNSNHLDDSILNNVIIMEFTNKDKMFEQYVSGGFEAWMRRFDCNISPFYLGRVNKSLDLCKHIWEHCRQPSPETFAFNCRAFGPPNPLPDTLPYNTKIYKAIAGDTAAQQTICDSISRLKDPQELYNAMQILGYIGSIKAMRKALEYFPDTTYIFKKVYTNNRGTPKVDQKTSLRKAIIEALAYNNPNTVPDSFLQNYMGSDNWYQLVTDSTGNKMKYAIRAICEIGYGNHCIKNGPYYPTRLINDLQKVADWASKKYECQVKMPTSDYKVIPLICIGGELR